MAMLNNQMVYQNPATEHYPHMMFPFVPSDIPNFPWSNPSRSESDSGLLRQTLQPRRSRIPRKARRRSSGQAVCFLYPIGSMVLLYMVTWIPSIYPLYVSIYIYIPYMDPMGTVPWNCDLENRILHHTEYGYTMVYCTQEQIFIGAGLWLGLPQPYRSHLAMSSKSHLAFPRHWGRNSVRSFTPTRKFDPLWFLPCPCGIQRESQHLGLNLTARHKGRGWEAGRFELPAKRWEPWHFRFHGVDAAHGILW